MQVISAESAIISDRCACWYILTVVAIYQLHIGILGVYVLQWGESAYGLSFHSKLPLYEWTVAMETIN